MLALATSIQFQKKDQNSKMINKFFLTGKIRRLGLRHDQMYEMHQSKFRAHIHHSKIWVLIVYNFDLQLQYYYVA